MSQEQDVPEEDSLKGIETIAEAESFWFEQPEEKRHQMLLDTVDAGFVASHLPSAKFGQAMFRVGYYYGRKEE